MTSQMKFLDDELIKIWKPKYQSIFEDYPSFGNTELFFNL